MRKFLETKKFFKMSLKMFGSLPVNKDDDVFFYINRDACRFLCHVQNLLANMKRDFCCYRIDIKHMFYKYIGRSESHLTNRKLNISAIFLSNWTSFFYLKEERHFSLVLNYEHLILLL